MLIYQKQQNYDNWLPACGRWRARNSVFHFANFNVSNRLAPAQQVIDSGWPDLLDGEVVAPDGMTCAAGRKGSTIDFLLVSKSAVCLLLSLSVDWQVVWSPHGALRFMLCTRPSALRTRTLAKPRNLPIIPQETLSSKEAAEAWLSAVRKASAMIKHRPEARDWHDIDLAMWISILHTCCHGSTNQNG